MTLLRLENVSIGYGNTPQSAVAQGINLSLPPQQITCLLGANGCGKTTLLKTILGILPPLSGTLRLYGKPLSAWQKRELAQAIGYVPQAQQPHFAFSVQEMVLMGRSAHLPWYATPSKSDQQIAQTCLAQLNIAHLQHRTYSQLSGGERQLVMIARALAQQARFLILDEPTSNLDFGNQIRVLSQIQRLKSEGYSILMTTHQPEHALQIADQVVLLQQGQIFTQGAAAEILTADNLAQIYHLDKTALLNALKQRIL